MNQNRVQHCIEQICLKGCTDVREAICALEQRQMVAETLDLNSEEIRAVISELKNIMAVYQK